MTWCANTSACDTIAGVFLADIAQPAVGPPEGGPYRASVGSPEGGPRSASVGPREDGPRSASVGPREDGLRSASAGPSDGGPHSASVGRREGGFHGTSVRAGQGRLCVARAGRRSVVTRAYATSPLRLLTPANHGSAAWIYTSSYGGGFVDGDRLDVEVEVARGAAAFLSTQAATKVYRSPSGTRATLQARVDEDALFVLAPDPVVCFAGARYRQEQRFAIAPGAGLVVLDAIVSGRHAAGERWAFLEYQSLIEVTIGGRMVVYDPLALRAADGNLAERLGRFEVLATAIIAGASLRDEGAQVLAACGREPLARRAGLLMAASPLGQDGCIVRVGATTTEQLTRALRALLHFLPSRLGDDPWRRKW